MTPDSTAIVERLALADAFEQIDLQIASGHYGDTLAGLALPAAELHSLLAHVLDRAAELGSSPPLPGRPRDITVIMGALTEAALHGSSAAHQLAVLAAAHGRLHQLASLAPNPALALEIHAALDGVDGAQAALHQALADTAVVLRTPAAPPTWPGPHPFPLPRHAASATARPTATARVRRP
jgi:hypothetical protein